MATNFLGNGETLTYHNPINTAGDGAISAGDGVLAGNIFGVAIVDIAEDAEGALALTGVWRLAKTSAQAWTQGDLIYWDTATGAATNVDSTAGLVAIGKAYAAASNPSSTGDVLLGGGALN
jgi:predicted RecA/RadA family phage recombinase